MKMSKRKALGRVVEIELLLFRRKLFRQLKSNCTNGVKVAEIRGRQRHNNLGCQLADFSRGDISECILVEIISAELVG